MVRNSVDLADQQLDGPSELADQAVGGIHPACLARPPYHGEGSRIAMQSVFTGVYPLSKKNRRSCGLTTFN